MIHLTIDGIPVEVEKGTTILQAARQIGVEIPTLCYLEDVLPDGSCRLCVVEGCTKCARNCPVGAITGNKKEPHSIDTSKCIKCGTCLENCVFGAISVN